MLDTLSHFFYWYLYKGVIDDDDGQWFGNMYAWIKNRRIVGQNGHLSTDQLVYRTISMARNLHYSQWKRYALPSLRYHLSVHSLHKTHLDSLDMLAKTYIKKWLGIPLRGVSDVAIFHPYMLKVKQPSTLYLEGQAGNHASMKLKGDSVVKAALDSQVTRESG